LNRKYGQMNSVKSFKDLITTHDRVIAGFKWQAETKYTSANSYYEIANNFVKRASTISDIDEILGDKKLREFALGAAMLSQKSQSHFNESTLKEILKSLIDVSRLNDEAYVYELNNRYFLTAGDSLGGAMRNKIGQHALSKVDTLLLHTLAKKKYKPVANRNATGKITSIKWDGRLMYFDKKPKFIGKSIDFIILKDELLNPADIEKPDHYLACGELKGGIDPAGADEHWKTASKALERIKDAFTKKGISTPKLFFFAAAIEESMAKEIFHQYKSGELIPANINYEAQLLEAIEIVIS
jgi:hypothetical protein